MESINPELVRPPLDPNDDPEIWITDEMCVDVVCALRLGNVCDVYPPGYRPPFGHETPAGATWRYVDRMMNERLIQRAVERFGDVHLRSQLIGATE